jgi:hypothetical protein
MFEMGKITAIQLTEFVPKWITKEQYKEITGTEIEG